MTRRRSSDHDNDIDLLDLLDGTAERIEEQRRLDAEVATLRQLWEQRRAGRPDGQPVPTGEDWCGRCGQNTFDYGLVINHDLGYLGCPVEVDPTWSKYQCVGFRGAVGYPSSTLTVEDLCDRWDRQFFPDCVCGHPWGVHTHAAHPTWSFSCATSCGCPIYREQSGAM